MSNSEIYPPLKHADGVKISAVIRFGNSSASTQLAYLPSGRDTM